MKNIFVPPKSFLTRGVMIRFQFYVQLTELILQVCLFIV